MQSYRFNPDEAKSQVGFKGRLYIRPVTVLDMQGLPHFLEQEVSYAVHSSHVDKVFTDLLSEEFNESGLSLSQLLTENPHCDNHQSSAVPREESGTNSISHLFAIASKLELITLKMAQTWATMVRII